MDHLFTTSLFSSTLFGCTCTTEQTSPLLLPAAINEVVDHCSVWLLPFDIRAVQRRRLEHPFGAGELQEPLGLRLVTGATSGPAVEQSLAQVRHLGRERPPQEQRPVPQRDGEVAPAATDGVHDVLGAPRGAHHREQADLSLNKTTQTHHSLSQHPEGVFTVAPFQH